MTKCARKKVYLSRREALKAIRRTGRRLYYYVCPYCGNYHLTKMRPGKFERRESARRACARSRYTDWKEGQSGR